MSEEEITLREFLETKIDGLRDYHIQSEERIMAQFKTVIDHQMETNGRVNKAEDQLGCIEKDIATVRWIKNNPKLFGFGAVLIFSILYIVLDAFGAAVILKLLGLN